MVNLNNERERTMFIGACVSCGSMQEKAISMLQRGIIPLSTYSEADRMIAVAREHLDNLDVNRARNVLEDVMGILHPVQE